VALHHHRDAARDFDVFDAAAQLGFGFAKSFSVLDADEPGEFIKMLFEEILQLEKASAAA
jgi:hypothetical protein